MGESRFRVISRHEETIPANSTVIVDAELLSQFDNIEYSFVVKKLNSSKSLKMLVLRTDLILKDQVYSRIGDSINIELNTISNGIDYSLEVKNNESVSVGLVFHKTIL